MNDMNNISIQKKAASTFAGKTNEPHADIWVDGETKTMALRFSLISSVIGFFVGLALAVYLSSIYNVPERLAFIPFFIPVFTLIVGAFSGAFVGAGTPRRNLEPEQGRKVGWKSFYKRMKDWS